MCLVRCVFGVYIVVVIARFRILRVGRPNTPQSNICVSSGRRACLCNHQFPSHAAGESRAPPSHAAGESRPQDLVEWISWIGSCPSCVSNLLVFQNLWMCIALVVCAWGIVFPLWTPPCRGPLWECILPKGPLVGDPLGECILPFFLVPQALLDF